MRGLWIAVGATLVLLAASWGWLQRTQMDARIAAQTMAAFMDFVSAENGLHRAILSARAGSLRNYDPLVRETAAMRAALGRMRRLAPTGARATAVLGARAEAEEELVERFKSTNALLQNSLATFSRLSEDLDGTEPLATRKADGLATAVLHLMVDPSPAGLAHLAAEIDRIEPTHPERHPGLSALIAHARHLRLLLPEMDATLAALSDAAAAREVDTVRADLLARQASVAARGDAVRLFLYAIALLLVGLLAGAGLALRARIGALSRRAAIEHSVAKISLRFLNTPSWQMEDHMALALEELSLCFGATRGYFIVPGKPEWTLTWSRTGPPFPASWARDVTRHMARTPLADNGIVHVEDVRAACDGTAADLACEGIASWLWIARVASGEVRAVLGFDSVRRRAFRRSDADQLLALAFDALTNAVAKCALVEERERLESKLQHAKRLETVGVFASGIAHNFNNIVGAIMGHAEMAAIGMTAGSRLAGHIEAIQLASERARQLVDQVLGFGRRSESMRRPTRVDRLLAETVSLLATSLPPHARLVVREAPGPAVVQADPGQLQQILLNLCRNAADAIDGDGTIRVATRSTELAQPRGVGADVLAPGPYVVITVEDDGCGMDEATLARIFEPFFTTRRQGNGLGLATAREIAREHHGAIAVHSEPGAGSRFEVWLPEAPADAVEDDRVGDGGRRPLQPGSGETVMLVERDARRRVHIEEVLAALGYEPVAFADWARAVAAIRAAPTRFDAALICAGGGAFPGADSPAALREAAPRIPIVLSTETAPHFDTERLTHAGIAEVIPYPPTSAQLADALATRFGARRDPRARLGTDTGLGAQPRG